MDSQLLSSYLTKFDNLIDTLVEARFCVLDHFFDPLLISALHAELCQHLADNELHAARVGKDDQAERISEIRGDEILWLTGKSEAQQQFLLLMEHYRQRLNQQLFLGLEELEAHFAHYPAGTGYQKHLDSFQNDNLRRITIVVYLNPEWSEADGGQLQIFADDQLIAEVHPQSGTLVSFVSEEIPHQVAITQRDRYSIAGWFRVRDDKLI